MQGENDQQRESRRILDRVEQESARDVLGAAGRAARRVRSHVDASNVDPDDRIEVVGTRIGRVLGLIVTAVLLALFLWFLIDG
ncbi:MAG: hypothetical protein AB7I79_05570 [Rhizobiaceae bacterium]